MQLAPSFLLLGTHHHEEMNKKAALLPSYFIILAKLSAKDKGPLCIKWFLHY